MYDRKESLWLCLWFPETSLIAGRAESYVQFSALLFCWSEGTFHTWPVFTFLDFCMLREAEQWLEFCLPILPQLFCLNFWFVASISLKPSGNHFPSSNSCYQPSLDPGYAHFGSPFFLTSQKILWNYKILVDWWKTVLLCLPAEKKRGDELCDMRPGPQKL